MKRSRIVWVVSLMSVALLGLIGFQWYWIDSVIRANEEGFRRDVVDALHTVTEKLEKQEALYVFNQSSSWVYRQQYQSQTRPKFWQSKPGQSNSYVFSDTVKSDQMGFNIIFDFEATSNSGYLELKAEQQPLQQIQEPVHEDQMLRLRQIEEQMERATKKSEMVVQVLESVLIPERSVMSRFNPAQLDSLLSREFNERGIDIAFNYGVISPMRQRFTLINNHDSKEELEKSELKASLFPNDLIGEPNWLVVNFPNKQQFLLRKIWLTMTSSGLLILVIVGSFGYSIHTILRQKKLSEMKNDFINNMTHELKTPIATISLACEALSDTEIKQIEGMRERYLKMISEENSRLGEQVERVLQMAAIDRNDIELKLDILNLEDLVERAVDKTMIQVEARSGTIRIIDNARDKLIYGDRTHLINIIVNLMDNANKYSEAAPDITVRLFNRGSDVNLAIQDRGIGMTKEAVSHIFQKFYRVPTGNVHNVKGFGLGLAYVKNMVELHHGSIQVDSEPGNGSKFTITLPLYNAKA
ncbi:MAG: HAMP domain-containing sensor histidine kinase [Marinoscillum sp.]